MRAGERGLLEIALAEFDAFAAEYQELVSDSIRITGESSEYFAAYKAEYIARNVAPCAGGRLLDYGCGVGLLSGHLRRCLPDVRIDGFDVSQDSVARIDNGLASQGVFTSRLSEIEKVYDVIVLSNVLHHVKPEERQGVIRDVCSRLGPGGKLFIIEHNPLNPLTRWAVSQCPFDGDAVLLPGRETRVYLRREGLNIMRQDYIVFFPRWLSWLRPLEPSIRWCALGAQYAVIGGKP